jgi:hypothetical protein
MPYSWSGNRLLGQHSFNKSITGKTPPGAYTSVGVISFISIGSFSGGGDYLHDSAGGFLSAGFDEGVEIIEISGSSLNDRKMIVQEVTSTFIYLAAGEEVITEVSGAGTVTISVPPAAAVTGDSVDIDSGDVHDRLHNMNSSSDHNSPSGTNGNMVNFDVNGYPVVDSGYSPADLLDCDNHTSGSTNFILAQQSVISKLSQTITNPPTQAEVQAITNKVDEIIQALRDSNVSASS